MLDGSKIENLKNIDQNRYKFGKGNIGIFLGRFKVI